MIFQSNMKKIFTLILLFIFNITPSFGNTQCSTQMSVTIPKFINIIPITSNTININIQNNNGILNTAPYCEWRIISNSPNTILNLRAESITSDGVSNSMFMIGNTVYLAFTNVLNKPSELSLNNCKSGLINNPNVVAYPIILIHGAKYKYNKSVDKYKILMNNGDVNIKLNIGTIPLSTSWGKGDKKGIYQTTLYLTEGDI